MMSALRNLEAEPRNELKGPSKALARNDCFYKLGVLSVGVLVQKRTALWGPYQGL